MLRTHYLPELIKLLDSMVIRLEIERIILFGIATGTIQFCT